MCLSKIFVFNHHKRQPQQQKEQNYDNGILNNIAQCSGHPLLNGLFEAYISDFNKKNSHEKVRDIQYKQLKISEYLGANNLRLSVSDRQFLFQCRVNDIDARANRTWKYQEIYCISCKDRNTIETEKHILEYSVLNNQNDKISYITTYNDLYSNYIQDHH